MEEHEKGVGQEEYKSALLRHSNSTGHVIEYAIIDIIDQASNERKLLLKEMLYINKLRPNLNTQNKSELFSLIISES